MAIDGFLKLQGILGESIDADFREKHVIQVTLISIGEDVKESTWIKQHRRITERLDRYVEELELKNRRPPPMVSPASKLEAQLDKCNEALQKLESALKTAQAKRPPPPASEIEKLKKSVQGAKRQRDDIERRHQAAIKKEEKEAAEEEQRQEKIYKDNERLGELQNTLLNIRTDYEQGTFDKIPENLTKAKDQGVPTAKLPPGVVNDLKPLFAQLIEISLEDQRQAKVAAKRRAKEEALQKEGKEARQKGDNTSQKLCNIALSKNLDSASTKLFVKFCEFQTLKDESDPTEVAIPTARLWARKAGGAQLVFMEWEFRDVFVKSIEWQSNDTGEVTEEVTLQASEVKMTYKSQLSTGALESGAGQINEWDFKSNKSEFQAVGDSVFS